MFNWKKDEPKQVATISPAQFDRGSVESRAAARMLAQQLEDSCECVYVTLSQLAHLNPGGNPTVARIFVCEMHRKLQLAAKKEQA